MKTNTFNLNTTGGKSKWILPSSILSAIFIFLICNLFTKSAHAQSGVAINITGQAPKSSAALDLSTGNGGKYGFLAPKTGLDSATDGTTPIASPSNGLFVYDTVTSGKTPHTITANDFYYWNSGSASSPLGTLPRWVGLNNNPNIPYGNNTHYWDTSGNMGPAPNGSFGVMGPNITFTPVHSVVYLTFTAAFYTNTALESDESVEFQVRNGATVLATGSSMCSMYAAGFVDVYNTAGDFSMTLPIAVTKGVKTTLKIYWQGIVAAGSVYGYEGVDNTASSTADGNNASLFIND